MNEKLKSLTAMTGGGKSIWRNPQEILEWTTLLVWMKNSGLSLEECRNAIKLRLTQKNEEAEVKK